MQDLKTGKELNKQFTKEVLQAGNKHTQSISTSLITGSIQIKLMLYHIRILK